MWLDWGRALGQGVIPPPERLVKARETAAAAKISVTPLRGGVSALTGSGGNIAVLTGADGLLMVDAGFSTSQPQISQALAGLGGSGVRTLINTHWHFDHTDGNEWVHAAGATITAHANTLRRMSTNQEIAAYGMKFGPSPVGARPTITFDTEKTLRSNGTTVAMKHYAPAHTDTDVRVHFPEADVLHAGDTFWNGIYPFIDSSSGGNIDGMIAATEANLALAGEKTIVIPGHGPIGNKAKLTEFYTMLTGCRESVAALKKQGRTVDEARAAKPTAAFDAVWSHSAPAADFFVGLVYQGV